MWKSKILLITRKISWGNFYCCWRLGLPAEIIRMQVFWEVSAKLYKKSQYSAPLRRWKKCKTECQARGTWNRFVEGGRRMGFACMGSSVVSLTGFMGSERWRNHIESTRQEVVKCFLRDIVHMAHDGASYIRSEYRFFLASWETLRADYGHTRKQPSITISRFTVEKRPCRFWTSQESRVTFHLNLPSEKNKYNLSY